MLKRSRSTDNDQPPQKKPRKDDDPKQDWVGLLAQPTILEKIFFWLKGPYGASKLRLTCSVFWKLIKKPLTGNRISQITTAAEQGDLLSVVYLLEKYKYTQSEKVDACAFAAQGDRLEIVKLFDDMWSGIKPDERSVFYLPFAPMRTAAIYGHLDICQHFLSRYILDDVIRRHLEGWMMHGFVTGGHLELCAHLRDRPDAVREMLMNGAEVGNEQVCRTAWEWGARDFYTARRIAEDYCHIYIYELTLEWEREELGEEVQQRALPAKLRHVY